jgi:hypothetical protein
LKAKIEAKTDQIQEHKDFLTEKKFVDFDIFSLDLIDFISEIFLYQLKN